MSVYIVDNPSGGKLKITIEPYFEKNKNNLYIFGWPSFLGGADTRLAHTIKIWSKFMNITVIPNRKELLNQVFWVKYLKDHNCNISLIEQLPSNLEGVGIAMSNDLFFTSRIAHRAKEKGLYVIWSSEMMWHHKGELESVSNKIVDCVLYTSEFNKSALKPQYDSCNSNIKQYVIDNYIDPDEFPFYLRTDKTSQLNIGRLSRPDMSKYPENFPLFYKHLRLDDPTYEVMAWSLALSEKYSWFNFDSKWKLHNAEAMPTIDFLRKLDLFVYPLGHQFRESWGRSTAEAMLTGCPVVVPYGHHFINFIEHGKTGFMFKTYEECVSICKELERNPKLRKDIGLAGRQFLQNNTFNIDKHVDKWKEIFCV